MLNLTSEKVLQDLREGIVKLSFTKVKDGAVREMTATLRTDMIPEDKMPKTGLESPKEGLSAVRCFDLDLLEWRSFRVDSLLTFDPR